MLHNTLACIPEFALFSTNKETRKKPLPLSPPGNEKMVSKFLWQQHTVLSQLLCSFPSVATSHNEVPSEASLMVSWLIPDGWLAFSLPQPKGHLSLSIASVKVSVHHLPLWAIPMALPHFLLWNVQIEFRWTSSANLCRRATNSCAGMFWLHWLTVSFLKSFQPKALWVKFLWPSVVELNTSYWKHWIDYRFGQ